HCMSSYRIAYTVLYYIPTRPSPHLIVDFYDQLKSRSQGYASLDYEFAEYRAADLVRLDILVAGTLVDALSVIVHRDKAQHIGRLDRKSTRLNSSHVEISYSVCSLKH